MKKKVIIVIIILLLSTVSIIKFSYKKIKPIEEKKISIMIETDTGYEKSESNSWPDLKKYEYDSKLSSCEKGSIEFDSEEGKIILKTKSIDKCKIYFGKLGTKEHPYKISTIEDLVDLSNDVNNGASYAGEYFILTKDLDFSKPEDYEDSTRTDYGDINGNGDESEGLLLELTTGSGFIPIGNSETNSFQGTFDGGNNRVDNLYINNEALSSVHLGLFGIIKNSKIANLTVSGNIINAEKSANMGIVASGYGKINITNCYNEIKMKSLNTTYSIGGIIGTITGGESGVIDNCQNKVDLNGGGYLGGIIGGLAPNVKLTITNCKNEGNITNEAPISSIGGIIGFQDSSSILELEDCQNFGKITGMQKVGGLIGSDKNSANVLTIINSHNKGDLSVTTTEKINIYVGGLISAVNGQATIKNSHNEGKEIIHTSGKDYVGGLIGILTGSLKVENSYNSGNINADVTSYQSSMESIYGGLVSQKKNSGNIILNKCYNSGDIDVIGNSYSDVYIGGLIGDFWGSTDVNANINAYIINSYNIGNINNQVSRSSRKSGIIGESYLVSSVWILNSYNGGNITGVDSGSGIILDNSNEKVKDIYFNNIYNYGQINSVTNCEIYRSLSITPEKVAKVNYNNVYYEKGLMATNRSDINFSSLDSEKISSNEFVDILNTNIVDNKTLKNGDNGEVLSLAQINESLKDYTFSKWQLGENGYPELIME